MKKIDIYIDGRNFGKHGSAYGIILLGDSPNINKRYFWEISLNAKNVTSMQCTLYAFIYALKSVKKDVRKQLPVTVVCENQQALKYLEHDSTGKWMKELTPTNKKLFEMVRNIMSDFDKINFVTNLDQDLLTRVKSMSEKAAVEKKYVDNRNS